MGYNGSRRDEDYPRAHWFHPEGPEVERRAWPLFVVVEVTRVNDPLEQKAADSVPTPSGHFVIFLPFLRMRTGHTVAGVEFLPLRDGDGKAPAALETAVAPLERIQSGYVDWQGNPFTNCVVANRAGPACTCVWPRRPAPLPRVPRSLVDLYSGVWMRSPAHRRAVSGHCHVPAQQLRAGGGRPCALTRCRVVRGGGVMRCAGRRVRPGGAADGLALPAPAAPDTRRAGPRRRAIPAR